mgnify:CR=1 FL=1
MPNKVESLEYRVQITEYRVQITDYRVQITDAGEGVGLAGLKKGSLTPSPPQITIGY